MRSAYKLGFMLLFSVLLVSVYAGDKDKVKQKIQEANKVFTEEMMKGNYQACMDFYATDAINMPMFSKMNKGKDAIEAQFKKDSEMSKITDAEFNTLEVLGEKDMFVEIGTYNMTMEMKDSDHPMTDVGKYVNVWKVMPDGSVKIVADIWNTDINYMENQMTGENQDNEMMGGKKK